MAFVGFLSKAQQTFWSGLREKAEASFGLERIWLQVWFHDLQTQAADAKDEAGVLFRMFWTRSSFIDAKPVNIGVLASLGFFSIIDRYQ